LPIGWGRGPTWTREKIKKAGKREKSGGLHVIQKIQAKAVNDVNILRGKSDHKKGKNAIESK